MKNIIFILLIIANFTSNAQEIKVNANIDTNTILIGDQIKYNLILTKPLSSKITFPELNDSLMSKIIIVSKDSIDTLNINNQNITLKQSYIITSFDSGFYALPPIYFTQNKDTLFDTIAVTNPLLLQVLTFNVDTTKQQIADIKDIYDAPLTFKEFIMEYYPYIIAVLLAILIAIGIIIYIRKRKNKIVEIPKFIKPSEPAHVIAFRELQKLQNKKLWQKNKVKQYYVSLTGIIRKYIEYRFEVLAMEQTSSEIIDSLNPILNDKEKVKLLRDLFTIADLVKFAKYKPLPNDHDLSYKNAYNFIDFTKLVEKENKSNNNKENENNK